uniref:Uncharacterized protein n=1 Tax=viral metagenome TaxID=1070528 RepID=A0A6C0B1E9_9ZZZZ
MENKENITYFVDEGDLQREQYIDLATLQNELEETSISMPNNNDVDTIFFMMKDYEDNYSVKQLLVICEYYGLCVSKMKKQEIIEEIILFENNEKNIVTCMKRKELWYYINELKRDKIMKKFVIWDKNN